MFLVQREVPSDPSSLAYFFGCAGQAKAIAFDVHADDVDWFMDQAEQKGVKIIAVMDTHIHADHVSGGRALAERSGGEYMLYETSQPNFDFTPLTDGQKIIAGNVEAEVIYTPGHTMDSFSLLITDNSRAPEPWFLLTAHTLFVGSVGRPDLRGREKEMAGHLYDSIHNRILSLEGHIEIYPGAKAGSVCGVGISAKPVSTIAYEKRNNAFLQMDKEQFIEQVVSDLPPKPIGMLDIIQQNAT
ncbi:MAG: hydroxyacylglutathione hydrolase [Thiomicrorhabdus sp.]|nr:MAG: hydroxyacylglutathione hydrolase [Thiomicrorhabdus sp.]